MIGRDQVSLPNGAADHRSERHATHSSLMAAALNWPIREQPVLWVRRRPGGRAGDSAKASSDYAG